MYLIHIADIFAIPLFYLLLNYFYNKKYKSNLEILLYIFSIIGFTFDILFSIYFIIKEFKITLL